MDKPILHFTAVSCLELQSWKSHEGQTAMTTAKLQITDKSSLFHGTGPAQGRLELYGEPPSWRRAASDGTAALPRVAPVDARLSYST